MIWILSLLGTTFRTATPLLFAALAGMICERSGVILIALEAYLLIGAFTAASLSSHFHQGWIGFLGAGILTGLFALLYGFFVLRMKSNQIVAGTGLNLLAMGLTPFLCKALYGSSIATPTLSGGELLGSSVTWIVIALFAFLAAGWKRIPLILWIRVSGEEPSALESQGISVGKIRWGAIALAGVIAGWGGASLSLYLSSSFTRNMSSGRGFMALAAVILGKWKPKTTLLACVFFALAEAVQILLQGVTLFGEEPLPIQWVQILPYLVTIIVVAGWVGKSGVPSALGRSDH